jgi:hypothetical protein
MYVNEKSIPVESFQECFLWGREEKGEWWRG